MALFTLFTTSCTYQFKCQRVQRERRVVRIILNVWLKVCFMISVLSIFGTLDVHTPPPPPFQEALHLGNFISIDNKT